MHVAQVKQKKSKPKNISAPRQKSENNNKHVKEGESLQESIASSKHIAQMKNFQDNIYSSSKMQEASQFQANLINQPVQKQERNTTGLPDNLKSGIESLSGFSMSDVKVHFNSKKPAQLNAHAYAQGNEIHVARGQEKHLPHEAWHVVQQKQGRVKANTQTAENVNDNKALEQEANIMGTKALQMQAEETQELEGKEKKLKNGVIQKKVGLEFQTHGGKKNVKVDRGTGKGLESPGHGEVIKECEGFKVETDGTDLEYVTSAFTKEEELVKAVSRAAALHKKIIKGRKNLLGGKRDKKKNLIVGDYTLYKSGQLTAHPQATVGIKLDKLLGLMKALSGQPDDPKNKIYYGGSVSLKGYQRSRQKTKIQEAVTNSENLKDITKSAKGFMALISQYVQVGRHLKAVKGKPANAKNAMPIMSRTALNEIWKKLPQDDRDNIVKIMTDKDYRTTRNKLFGERWKKRLISQEEENPIKLKDWFNELMKDGKDGEDLLSQENIHSVSDLKTPDLKIRDLKDLDLDNPDLKNLDLKILDLKTFKLKNLDLDNPDLKVLDLKTFMADKERLKKYEMSSPTDIGMGDVDGAVVELRALTRNVKPDDWATIARRVMRITNNLNNKKAKPKRKRKKLKSKKKPWR